MSLSPRAQKRVLKVVVQDILGNAEFGVTADDICTASWRSSSIQGLERRETQMIKIRVYAHEMYCTAMYLLL
jgi:hypothetical protein